MATPSAPWLLAVGMISDWVTLGLYMQNQFSYRRGGIWEAYA